jgi:peptidoglycan hydrolase CwlO-like protein
MKRSIWFSFMIAIVAVFILAACETRRDDTTVDDRTVITDDNMNRDNRDIGTDRDFEIFEDNRNYTYDQRDDFKRDVERAIDRLDERIDRLEDRADDAEGQEKQMYDRRISELKAQRDRLENEVDRIDDADENTWEDVKSGVKSAWTDVKRTWNEATNELKYDDNEYRNQNDPNRRY